MSVLRLMPLFYILLGSVTAGESAFPLWDNHESVADYAKRVNLPPTKTLDLGNGVKMELVLIPAGKFIMGTAEPMPVDEDKFFDQIELGQILLAVGGGVLLVLLGTVIVRAIRKRQRPKFSLAKLLAMTATAGGCVLSGMQWRQSARGLEQAQSEYAAAQARYDSANPAEKPGHPVTLTKPYYMGKYLVTQEQYQQFLGTNPNGFGKKDDPLKSLWVDKAIEFCNRIGEKWGREVRLPTEAEWEFSCWVGTTTTMLNANIHAYEWCKDDLGIYLPDPVIDPRGSPNEHLWRHDGFATQRTRFDPGHMVTNFISFRVVLELAHKAP